MSSDAPISFEIVITRFDETRLNENYQFRKDHKYACFYTSPVEMTSRTIGYNVPVFVIEMNLTKNHVEGIGMITNRPYSIDQFSFASTEKRQEKEKEDESNDEEDNEENEEKKDRFAYVGKYFLSREVLMKINSPMMMILEEVLFVGKSHAKRGVGLTAFPARLNDVNCCQGMDMRMQIRDLFIFSFASTDESSSSSSLAIQEAHPVAEMEVA